jgi:RimJ/RimL family protein N-acetyltransferase
MLFVETERLRLRAFEKRDVPRYAELIGDWEVTRWMSRVPYPYSLPDAEEWLAKMEVSYINGKPELYLIADKKNNELMGAVSVRPPRVPDPLPGESVLGYWLGKPYWGQGFMSEAVNAALKLFFAQPEITVITATTDPANTASQRVLYKAGLHFLGVHPRIEETLRGSPDVTCWALPRSAYERSQIDTECSCD